MMNLIKKLTHNPKNDILSGITVALALVPEAVAFAFVAGIDPLIGLYGAFMVGLVTALFGGRPGMISGATGALAVVMVSLVKEGNEMMPGVENAGVQYLFATLIVMGLLQILAGVFKLGKFVRLIPHPVMLGFVNGLAIVIFLSQLGMFKSGGEWLEMSDLMVMLGLVALTMAIMYGLPKLTDKIPSGLAAILVVSLIVIFGGIDTATVQSFVQASGGEGIEGGLPSFMVPQIPLTWATLKFIFPYAAILAAIGLIESLMTLTLVDEITETRGSSNRECVAQGGANILNGFFGGMGGCAMIGQSMINVNSGGRGRLSGIVAALMLLSFILFLSPYIEQIPIAALVGVMFMVVIGTFAWSSFRIMHKIPFADAFVLVLVSGVTVVFDLAIAVICGVIVSALVFAWQNATKIRARKTMKEDGTKVYEIWGPLFFGSVTAFNSKFTLKEDPDQVEIDFIDSKVSDHSGVEAIRSIVNKYEEAGKTVKLKHLSSDCKSILMKANPKFDEIILTDIDDPRYYVMSDMAVHDAE
ncbi:SulP family inorganic anion transporter [Reichenbachiella ulvae]|uniref:SulP family inorganic anion transporter n=1 Tax=Reichenbachiella ulvae TaxID=2980104 RepID=A0ABT3CNM7_9BACT|nr:SulP family inorganic anion transporter [Reichenbachiella ulvae]MCV9385338.1 SulP family inorganic anion transporter [Reichenbachiella ulvae]